MVFKWILILALLSSCAIHPNKNTQLTEYGEFSYQISGSLKPTIVLESGMAGDMSEWDSTLKYFNKYSQVFTYNRSGFSGSQSNNLERDGQTIALELRALLRAVNVQPPFILVGHSRGGLYMQIFANQYPHEVSAIMLIDSTPSNFRKVCKNRDGSYCISEIPWWAKLFLPSGVANEYRELDKSLDQASYLKNFPQVPLVVLSSVNKSEGATKKSRTLAQKRQESLTKLSNNSKHIICNGCGHHIHKEKPELIINSLEWIFKQI